MSFIEEQIGSFRTNYLKSILEKIPYDSKLKWAR
jgi:hypothetical protein